MPVVLANKADKRLYKSSGSIRYAQAYMGKCEAGTRPENLKLQPWQCYNFCTYKPSLESG